MGINHFALFCFVFNDAGTTEYYMQNIKGALLPNIIHKNRFEASV